jgi:hypothetical protein
MFTSVPYVSSDERPGLHAFRYSRHSDNPYCMNLLLDFIEAEFELQPVESPGESITFIPPFVAIIGTALWDTSIWVSLYGEEHDFDGNDTVAGQFQSWRKFHVQNRSEDIARAKTLIRRACDNYTRSQEHIEWFDMVRAAEERWFENRNRELTWAKVQQLLRDL